MCEQKNKCCCDCVDCCYKKSLKDFICLRQHEINAVTEMQNILEDELKKNKFKSSKQVEDISDIYKRYFHDKYYFRPNNIHTFQLKRVNSDSDFFIVLTIFPYGSDFQLRTPYGLINDYKYEKLRELISTVLNYKPCENMINYANELKEFLD